MPQLIAIGLLAVLGWYAWRAFRREMTRIGAEMAEQEKKRAPKAAGDVTILEKGTDGVYRPKDG